MPSTTRTGGWPAALRKRVLTVLFACFFCGTYAESRRLQRARAEQAARSDGGSDAQAPRRSDGGLVKYYEMHQTSLARERSAEDGKLITR